MTKITCKTCHGDGNGYCAEHSTSGREYSVKDMTILKKLYHNLGYDWDAELNELHGEDLWDTPNENSRKVRKMVVEECMRVVEEIRQLPWYKRLFNLF